MAAHSHLGASSAKRWMTCPGSFALVEDVQGSGTSIYAAQGTAAHLLAERVLKGELARPRDVLGEFRWIDGHETIVDEEMCRTVQVYLDEVDRRRGPGVVVGHEKRVCLDRWFDVPPPTSLFGTADTLVYDQNTLRLTVIDFKYGSGVYVPVQDNPQLLYYAAGALLLLADKPVRAVEIVVVQPRARGSDPVRRDVIDWLDLRLWIELELKPAVERTRLPDAGLAIGTHCRFCAAKPSCPAYADRAQADARAEFDDAT